ncbi:MAG: GIY-YIG nuclease family protein [Parcubacteria group bacterium]|nr:GIY-YIG nuclease family protein [Parcubacteria group bacterium]
MNFIYILQSGKNGKYYIGSTNNLERRLTEHNAGKTNSLYYLRPLKLVFKKEFESLAYARQVEKRLKKLKNRNILERIIADQDITGLAMKF